MQVGGAPLDVLVTPEAFHIEVDLPGVSLEDVELTIEDSELTIQAVCSRRGLLAALALPGMFGSVISKTLANGVLTIAIGRKGTHEQLS